MSNKKRAVILMVSLNEPFSQHKPIPALDTIIANGNSTLLVLRNKDCGSTQDLSLFNQVTSLS